MQSDIDKFKSSLNEDNDELIKALELDENQNQHFSQKLGKKLDYNTRKLDGRLKKYEIILKNAENINRAEDSQILFVGNGGLNNNISYDFIHETFSQYGKILDVVMQKKKPYSFVIFESKSSVSQAIEHLQATEITKNQTPIMFYLLPVDIVPDMSLESGYRETMTKPEGLVYLENYIDKTYAEEIEKFLQLNELSEVEDSINLKKRRVRHYGYEFRYGTSDCDHTKPLTEEHNRMPDLLNDLFQKMLTDKLIQIVPDQMTVNFYEPGQGIPPHTDNVTAFNEFIISLSLKSSVQMEFRQNGCKNFFKIQLKPNSLLVLKGDSRYNWSHLIAERKHDLITNDTGSVTVNKREKRISLTFRKVISSDQVNSQAPDKTPNEIKLPENESEAVEFEQAHVHQVYNGIADHFSSTRHSAWPGVARFIESMQAYSLMLDVGCGNGKYLNLRKDLFCFGCDYSDQLIKICSERNFNCFVSDCLRIPAKTDHFDYLISIAVLHHLSTKERRVKALNEMMRVIKPGGEALVTVWAKEQKYNDKKSFYISKKNSDLKLEEDEINSKKLKNKIQIAKSEEESSPLCHKFGNEFEKQDLFVAWHYSKNASKKSLTEKRDNDESMKTESHYNETSENKKEKVFLRYYHVFENKELEDLFVDLPNCRIKESFYEQGNWCVIFEKM